MTFICSQLSDPDTSGLQNCLVWTEQSSLLPPITYVQANQIGLSILGVFAVVFIFNQLKRFLR